jgi:hypothetical protein
MLSWFDTKEVDAFAQWVIDELLGRLAPESLERPERDRKMGDRVHRMTEAISDRAREMARTQKPNFYQRARLGNRVKWALKEAGYPEEFATAFTTELITLVTVAGRG